MQKNNYMKFIKMSVFVKMEVYPCPIVVNKQVS